MYTLRRITGENIEINQNLGNSYTVVRRWNTEDFKKAYQTITPGPVREFNPESDNPDDRIFAFVSNENGFYSQPLYAKF